MLESVYAGIRNVKRGKLKGRREFEGIDDVVLKKEANVGKRWTKPSKMKAKKEESRYRTASIGDDIEDGRVKAACTAVICD